MAQERPGQSQDLEAAARWKNLHIVQKYLILIHIVVTIVDDFLRMFEWDEDKNRSNIRKHGLGFQTAIRIFENAVLSWADERAAYGEMRHHTIGQIEGVVFLAVIHTDRAGKIRIISARPANRRERKRYDEEIRKRAEP